MPGADTVQRFPVTPEPDTSSPTPLTTTTIYYGETDGVKRGLVHTITDPLGRTTTFEGHVADHDLDDQANDPALARGRSH